MNLLEVVDVISKLTKLKTHEEIESAAASLADLVESVGIESAAASLADLVESVGQDIVDAIKAIDHFGEEGDTESCEEFESRFLELTPYFYNAVEVFDLFYIKMSKNKCFYIKNYLEFYKGRIDRDFKRVSEYIKEKNKS